MVRGIALRVKTVTGDEVVVYSEVNPMDHVLFISPGSGSASAVCMGEACGLGCPLAEVKGNVRARGLHVLCGEEEAKER